MSKTVSWSEAFFFWFALFWRSIVLYMLLCFIIMLPLSLLFPNEHPAAIAGILVILVTIIFWFAMIGLIKMVLQKYINRKL
jgi:lipopolysaccharide export LptBFGC system permease protein LptF